MKKKKIVIITEGFPYWPGENFLHGEITSLCDTFEVSILPLLLPRKPSLQKLPPNVRILKPVMVRNYFVRFLNGVFNLSPIWPFIEDFQRIFSDGRKNIRYNFIRWSNIFVNSRTLYASERLKDIKKDKDTIIYVYWCNYANNLFKTFPNRVFVRVHGSEIGTLVSNYLPLKKERFSIAPNINYLPISIQASEVINKEAKVKCTINRLGVFKNTPRMQQQLVGKIRIVSVAYLIPVKRIHLIVKALNEVKDVQIEWVHFGNGPLFDDIMEKSKSLPDNITVLMKNYVPNKEIIRYYENNYVDLFVNVSSIEGVPVSIMEAMSFGIPCFATDVGGTKELVNNQNGKIVEKEFDPEDLSLFIRNIKTLSRENHFRINALNTWETKSNAAVNYRQLADIFSKE